MRIGVFPVRNADLTNFRIRNVQTNQPRSHDGDLHSILTLTLGTIRVNGCTGQTPIVQEVIEAVRLCFGIDKDECARGRHGEKQVVKALLLGGIICVDHLDC
jgi:hypothetical protein